MNYNYNSPTEAIISLENAYTNKDLDGIITSKDFIAEAKLILKDASYNYDINDTKIVNETAELLKTALVQSLNENGFPSFKDVKRTFSELKELNDNIYFIEEKLSFPSNLNYTNKIYLSNNKEVWKVAMIEE
jgi:thiamine kinase-like enzyme